MRLSGEIDRQQRRPDDVMRRGQRLGQLGPARMTGLPLCDHAAASRHEDVGEERVTVGIAGHLRAQQLRQVHPQPHPQGGRQPVEGERLLELHMRCVSHGHQRHRFGAAHAVLDDFHAGIEEPGGQDAADLRPDGGLGVTPDQGQGRIVSLGIGALPAQRLAGAVDELRKCSTIVSSTRRLRAVG
jgi:hypothetical protein